MSLFKYFLREQKMVFLTQMVLCLHVNPRTRALANLGVSGARGVSAESAASEGKKYGPYNMSIAVYSYSAFYAHNSSWIIDNLVNKSYKTYFLKIFVKIFLWVPLTHEN